MRPAVLEDGAVAIGRDKLVARWLELTRDVLPKMAGRFGWPITFDHCFMRVCLDEALGAPWTNQVSRPAIRSMNLDQLAAVVSVAEAIVAQPKLLVGLNQKSLDGRRDARR